MTGAGAPIIFCLARNVSMSTEKLFKDVIKYVWHEPSNQGRRCRKLVSAFKWQIRKRVSAKPVAVQLWNGAKYIAYPQDSVASHPFYTHIYQSEFICFANRGDDDGVMLDVGGAELKVLSGASKTLAAAPNLLIMFERLKTSGLEEITNLLEGEGYVVFAVDNGLPDQTPSKLLRAHDLFACKQSKFDLVCKLARESVHGI